MIGCGEVTVTEPLKLAIPNSGPRFAELCALGGSVTLEVPITEPLASRAVKLIFAALADGLAYATPVV